MVKTILLDCGGVMCRPKTGIWLFPLNFHTLMDGYLTSVTPLAHRNARAKAAQLMDADHHLYTEEIECQQLFSFYRKCYCEELDLPVPEATLWDLAISETYDDSRFLFYDDVLPMLTKWSTAYRLGMVSDTHPSLRRIMRNNGTLRLLDAVSLSCENGVFKPDPRMYTCAMEALQADPKTTIFVDDLEKNLYGAEALGIRGVKITRDQYTDEPIRIEDAWKGPHVCSLAQLDTILEEL